MSNDAVGAALHKQGTYALQKVLESPCRDSEFVQLGKSLMERALDLVGGEPGIYVMAKLVDQLVGLHTLHSRRMNRLLGLTDMTLLRLYKGLLPITHTGMETTFKAARPMSPALPKSLQFVHVFPRNKHSTSLKPAVMVSLPQLS